MVVVNNCRKPPPHISCTKAKWSSSAKTVAEVGWLGSTKIHLYLPNGIFIDQENNLFVADQHNNRIQKFIPHSTVGLTVAGYEDGVSGSRANELHSPEDVYVHSDGNIFVADYFNYRVQKFSPNDKMAYTVAGGNRKGSKMSQLEGPNAITIDKTTGNLYMA